MFHPKSIPDQEWAVSPRGIAVPAKDGLVKLSLNSTRRNECSVGRRQGSGGIPSPGPADPGESSIRT